MENSGEPPAVILSRKLTISYDIHTNQKRDLGRTFGGACCRGQFPETFISRDSKEGVVKLNNGFTDGRRQLR